MQHPRDLLGCCRYARASRVRVGGQIDLGRVSEDPGPVRRSDPSRPEHVAERVAGRVEPDHRHPSLPSQPPETVGIPLGSHGLADLIHDH